MLDDAWDKDLRYMTNQDTDLNPRVDQWNNGTDAGAELTRMMTMRRAGIERFGETAIQKDWPMAMLEEVLVPLYLHHRYAVEARGVGGRRTELHLRDSRRRPDAGRVGAGRGAAARRSTR